MFCQLKMDNFYILTYIFFLILLISLVCKILQFFYSTVTDLAKFLGLSTSNPLDTDI